MSKTKTLSLSLALLLLLTACPALAAPSAPSPVKIDTQQVQRVVLEDPVALVIDRLPAGYAITQEDPVALEDGMTLYHFILSNDAHQFGLYFLKGNRTFSSQLTADQVNTAVYALGRRALGKEPDAEITLHLHQELGPQTSLAWELVYGDQAFYIIHRTDYGFYVFVEETPGQNRSKIHAFDYYLIQESIHQYGNG